MSDHDRLIERLRRALDEGDTASAAAIRRDLRQMPGREGLAFPENPADPMNLAIGPDTNLDEFAETWGPNPGGF